MDETRIKLIENLDNETWTCHYSLNLDHMDNTWVFYFMEFAKILPIVSQCSMKLKYLQIGNHGKAKLSFRNIIFPPMSTGNFQYIFLDHLTDFLLEFLKNSEF